MLPTAERETAWMGELHRLCRELEDSARTSTPST